MLSYIQNSNFLKKTTIKLLAIGVALVGSNSFAALPEFSGLVEKNKTGVVNISTHKKPSKPTENLKLPKELEETPYGEFLKKFLEEQERAEQDSYSLGSGTIISNDGYIVTNNHVVRDSDEVMVKLIDQREFIAKVVGTDKDTDLALLKIDAKDLSPVTLGNSSDVKVGDWVLAIGAPFGFEYSATAGIVSGLGRSIGNERYVPFIQTDVAINPGNSGGPLFNLSGEVIGINSQILSRTGGYLGLSFAIPTNVVNNVVDQIKSKGFVQRGWLGVSFQSVDRKLAKSFGLNKVTGALVVSVLGKSPAGDAGIQSGDIIIKFNNHTIMDATDLPPIVGALKPGDTVPVELLRNHKYMTVNVKIGLKEKDEARKAKESRNKAVKNPLGVSVVNPSKDKRTELKLAENQGVIISYVEKNSAAAKIGLRKGDVILQLNQIDIKSSDEFYKIVNKINKNQWIPILVKRGPEAVRYLAFKIS